MINTQEGKWKRHQEYLERGWWNLRHLDSEPYVTWEDLIGAIENSLQLSATDCISNTEKGKNE
jgi:hypothetical protein